MRLSEDTRFPHPVLSANARDFAAGEFQVQFVAVESPATGGLTLEHSIALTEPGIRDLVVAGQASIGCFVRCVDTYFTQLVRLSWPNGRTDFIPGTLLNRVSLRPLIWLEQDLRDWDPGTLHPEFEPPVSLTRGDVVGVAPEHVMSVGQAKFAPLESVFELRPSDAVEEGTITVDPEHDRIRILVAPRTYETIVLLRGQGNGIPLLMSAVYLPAVMELLDMMRAEPDQFEGRRWYQPIMAKCDANGVDLQSDFSILEAGQALLAKPGSSLPLLLTDEQ